MLAEEWNNIFQKQSSELGKLLSDHFLGTIREMIEQLMPNSTFQADNSRRSPILRSEINSMQFDLGDEEVEKPLNPKDKAVTSRKGCRSVIRGNKQVNDARSITSGGSSMIPISRASKLRHDLNISTPSSMAMDTRANSNNITDYKDDNNSMNRSVYQNLQAKIDRNRKISTIEQTPKARVINNSKLTIDESEDKDHFTDLMKLRPKKELDPIPVKMKINFAPHQNVPIQSEKEKQMLVMNTNAFLYSKIPDPNKQKKKSIIVSDATLDDYGITSAKSAKVSTHNKSIVSSLISTLGQRKREPKSVAVNPFSVPRPQIEANERLNASPKIMTEKARLPNLELLNSNPFHFLIVSYRLTCCSSKNNLNEENKYHDHKLTHTK